MASGNETTAMEECLGASGKEETDAEPYRTGRPHNKRIPHTDLPPFLT
jgi:hypothetical protein